MPHDIITEVSFAAGGTLDYATPIILATLATTLQNIKRESLSSTEIEKLVHQSAARYRAKPGLIAVLLHHIPALCMEILTTKPDEGEALVSVSPEPSYRIWTNGETWVIDSIERYEMHKNKYLFWVDLNEKVHVSKRFAKRRLTPRAIKLLKYLVERLGNPVPIVDVMRDVFDDIMSDDPGRDKNKIDQELTVLHTFCGKQFRQYCFGNWFNKGLGLKKSFADKYFIFERQIVS